MIRGIVLAQVAGLLTLHPISIAAEPDDVVVRPARIDDVLTNPNMGFADFHMGWHCEDPGMSAQACAKMQDHHWPENYPQTAVTYFRWHWDQLEPAQGEIDFDYIDRRIQASNLTGQTLAFRIMAIREGGSGIPAWLRKQIKGVEIGGTYWPDYRDPVFQREHRRFVMALARRYDGHPAVDHIDIGPVGCWGEWNTACCEGPQSLIELYRPADNAQRDAIAAGLKQIVADYADAFTSTPLVMLAVGSDGDPRMIDIMGYALRRGTGWRVDCWGDFGIFSDNWSHHRTLYPNFMENVRRVYPAFDDVWKHAPVQLEVCGTMPQWKQKGWSADAPDGKVHKAFQFALDQHAAVLNAKRTEIPAEYVPAMKDLLRRNGYRYVIDRLRHPRTVRRGGTFKFSSTWSNLGCTPSYTRRQLVYRLSSDAGRHEMKSDADVRKWLPGTWEMQESVQLPEDLPAGKYRLEVAILDRAGAVPETRPLPPLQLAMVGRAEDGWYTLSQIEIVPADR